jgi:hypothetical protein
MAHFLAASLLSISILTLELKSRTPPPRLLVVLPRRSGRLIRHEVCAGLAGGLLLGLTFAAALLVAG